MNHAHLEFPSPEDIDRDVDRVFRAYCDTTLLKFAKTSVSATDYWARVVTFRRENFGPLDRSEFVERARGSDKVEAVPPEKQRQRWIAVGSNYTGRLEFLYWFDVRADFWPTLDKTELDNEVVVTPEQLKTLLAAIETARERLHPAKALTARDWRCRDRNDEILKSLTGSPPGEASPSSPKGRRRSSPEPPAPSSTPSDESS